MAVGDDGAGVAVEAVGGDEVAHPVCWRACIAAVVRYISVLVYNYTYIYFRVVLADSSLTSVSLLWTFIKAGARLAYILRADVWHKGLVEKHCQVPIPLHNSIFFVFRVFGLGVMIDRPPTFSLV